MRELWKESQWQNCKFLEVGFYKNQLSFPLPHLSRDFFSPPPSSTCNSGHRCGWGRYQKDRDDFLFLPQPPPAASSHGFAEIWRRSGRRRPNFKAVDLPPPATISVDPGTRGQTDPQEGPSRGPASSDQK
ncbi:hypothetical protein L3X38_045434 [Prunus dulcis]|uniref:Uncharacterized protein n=1 Tax=Prunus dulcis TaxID=3755 RepID=A0AAD4V1P6_PRUDU|nr:hypothetical protein L3X38_045434 [Prunus dulcis]